MAWSNRNGNYWRAGVTLTKVSETDTSITLKYTALFSSNWRINVMSSIKWDMSTSGAYSWSSSSGGAEEGRYIESENDTPATLGTKEFTINKTTSSQTVTATNTVKVTTLSNGTQTATESYEIPAKTSYTVSFNANGGSGAPSSQTKWHGETLILSSTKPTRSGYTFIGWGSSTSDTTADYSASGSYTANQPITLYAIWEKTITLTYNANGGSGAPSNQEDTIYNSTTNKTFIISSTKPTRTGYTFLGWSTSSTATSSSYTAGASITLSNSTTLYAIWSENSLTVNYYSNYATESFPDALNTVGVDKNVIVRTSSYYYDNNYSENGHWDYSFPDSSTYLGRTGYTATGYWGTSPEGGTLVKQSTGFATGQAMAEAVGKSLKNGNDSVNLYAQWQTNDYTIDYNANGGSGYMSPQIVEWNGKFTILNNDFSRDGYKFLGWNLYRNNDNKWYVASHGWMTEDEIVASGYSKLLYVSGSELTLGQYWINGDDDARLFTFYAIWEISGVVYLDMDGSEFKPYLSYIDNGAGWDLYLMYIDNGTSWDIVS